MWILSAMDKRRREEGINSMKVSVIIPTYNRRVMLAEAINSVLNQSHRNFEIIIVDDGSTDATRALMTAYQSRYAGRLRYVYQPNRGPAAARNRALEIAEGDFISFLDSDDLWLPEKLETELAWLSQYPQYGGIVGDSTAYLHGEQLADSVHAMRGIEFDTAGMRPFCWSLPIMRLGPTCVTSSITLRRSVMDRIGAPVFDERFRVDEDWDFEFRLFLSCRVLLINQCLCHYRVVNDGTRHYYSIRGQTKSSRELQYLYQTKILILERYLDNPAWCSETNRLFTDRRNELQQLLAEQSRSCIPDTSKKTVELLYV